MINELEAYDKAIVEFFSIPSRHTGEPVPIVYSPPQRAFSVLERLYKPQNGKIPLPALSVHRGEFTLDSSRFHFFKRRVVSCPDPTGGTIVNVTPPPQTVTIPYFLEVWAYTTREMSSIIKVVATKFLQELAYITVDLEEYGKHYFALKLDGMSDASDLEPSEGERKLRTSFNLTLNGVFHKPLTPVKTVKIIQTDVKDESDTIVYETQEVSS